MRSGWGLPCWDSALRNRPKGPFSERVSTQTPLPHPRFKSRFRLNTRPGLFRNVPNSRNPGRPQFLGPSGHVDLVRYGTRARYVGTSPVAVWRRRRPGVKSALAVSLVGPGRQQDHRNRAGVGPRLRLASGLGPAAIRPHPVQQDRSGCSWATGTTASLSWRACATLNPFDCRSQAITSRCAGSSSAARTVVWPAGTGPAP